MDDLSMFTSELVCNSSCIVAISPAEESEMVASTISTQTSQPSNSSFLMRTAIKISRSQWFSFLRRVFHYQNGLRSEMGSNPFNSSAWMMTELLLLVVQINMIGLTLAISEKEKPVWPMRTWVSGYGFGCFLNLMLLCWRYRTLFLSRGDASSLPDIEQQSNNDESSKILQRIHKYRSFLELSFAIWFVVGNVWVYDTRILSVRRAPRLYILCVSLLSWNAMSYSFPFILFVLLCGVVPLLSTLLGYNMNMGAKDRGALEEQIAKLPSWKYKEIDSISGTESDLNDDSPECCICLANYKDKEEIRQLPCSHVFHLHCVDQWLRIISCCPLCKKELQR